MQTYAHDAATISDVLELISSPTLTISARNAPRVAQLQALLATVQPVDTVSATEFQIVHEALERNTEALSLANETIAKLQDELDKYRAIVREQSDSLSNAARRIGVLELQDRRVPRLDDPSDKVLHATNHATNGVHHLERLETECNEGEERRA